MDCLGHGMVMSFGCRLAAMHQKLIQSNVLKFDILLAGV